MNLSLLSQLRAEDGGGVDLYVSELIPGNIINKCMV